MTLNMDNYKRLEECSQLLTDARAQLNLAIGEGAGANASAAYATLVDLSMKMDDVLDEERPMKTVRVWQTVRFYRDIDVPADLQGTDLDTWLADHE